MAKKNGKVVEPVAETAEAEVAAVEEERSPLFDALRKVMLAYVGGFAVAWDELEDLVNRLVDRGEVAEGDARKLLHEMAEKRRPTGIDKRMEELLNKLDVPSKSDIQALGAKIAALTQKVDELKK